MNTSAAGKMRKAAAWGLWIAGLAGCSGKDDGEDTAPVDTGVEIPPPSVPVDPTAAWPKFRYDAEQTGRTYAAGIEAGEPWSAPTDGPVLASPVIRGDGVIYLGSTDGTLYALQKDGTLKWSAPLGGPIYGAALLDDANRVIVGADQVYAFDAETGAMLWQAPLGLDGAYVKGGVSIGVDGTLFVGVELPGETPTRLTTGAVLGLARDTGAVLWTTDLPGAVVSTPAIFAETGDLIVSATATAGEDNLFSLAATGQARWSQDLPGSLTASPLTTTEGDGFIGGYDGWLHAFGARDGFPDEELEARDIIVAAPARLSSGVIVQPSLDGTLHAFNGGREAWAYDTLAPIRSSPAVDGDDLTYFGGDDGRLYVVAPDGTLRWAIQLSDRPISSSPALGAEAIVIGGEDGSVYSVPYDWCLDHPEDTRCIPGPVEGLLREGVAVYPLTEAGGLDTSTAPAARRSQSLAFTLLVRERWDTVVQAFSLDTLTVTASPAVPFTTAVSADGRALVLTPTDGWSADDFGHLTIHLSGTGLEDLDREGLVFSGGEPGEDFDAEITFSLDAAGPTTLPLPAPTNAGQPAASWVLTTVQPTLPLLAQTYYPAGVAGTAALLTLVESQGTDGVAWMTGASMAEDGTWGADPTSLLQVPVAYRYSAGALVVEGLVPTEVDWLMGPVPMSTFEVRATLDATGAGEASVRYEAACADIPDSDDALREIGFCRPDTDALPLWGYAPLVLNGDGVRELPDGVGGVLWAGTREGVTASFTSTTLRPEDHRYALLLLDDASGAPVLLDYTSATTTTTTDGRLLTLTQPFVRSEVPSRVRVYFLVDGYPAARGIVLLPS